MQLPQGLQPEQLGMVQVQQFGLHWNLQHEGSTKQLHFGLHHEPQFGLQHDRLQHVLQFGLQHDGLQHELQFGLQHELQLGLQDGQSGLQQDTSQHEQLFGPQHGLLQDLQLGLQHDTSGHEQQEQSKQHGLLHLGKHWQEQQIHGTHMHNFDPIHQKRPQDLCLFFSIGSRGSCFVPTNSFTSLQLLETGGTPSSDCSSSLRKSTSRLRIWSSSCSRRRPHKSGYLGGDLGRGGSSTTATCSPIGLTCAGG